MYNTIYKHVTIMKNDCLLEKGKKNWIVDIPIIYKLTSRTILRFNHTYSNC